MTIKIVTVGKVKTKHWQLAVDEYIRRLQRFADVQQTAVKDASTDPTANPKIVKETEGKNLLSKIAADEHVVVLDTAGQQMSSEDLASFLETRTVRGINKFTFVVGGPLGLAPGVLEQADLVLSLSAMTLPHELAKVILVEQIYRAFTILRNEKYHK
jgi:23S rRNA (pseudouridine1915-N3)-methyltransferase